MSLSLQECLSKLKEAHPDLYPVSYIEGSGKYLVNMLKRGVDRNEATTNFYTIDPADGKIYGPIPVLSLIENEEIAAKMEHPHMISGEDQKKLVHTVSADGAYWGVTRNTDSGFLAHYGIKGQKWGVRRFQNEDGTWTAEGKIRYGSGGEGRKSNAEENGVRGTGLKGFSGKSGGNRVQAGSAKAGDGKSQNSGAKGTGDSKPAAPAEKLTWKEKSNLRTAFISEKFHEAMNEEVKVDREKTKQGDATTKVVKDIAFTVLNPFNVAYLATDGAMALRAKAKLNGYLKKREQNSEKDPETGLYKKKPGEYDEKQDLAAVNPGFLDMNSNTKNNCMLCTTTYDMRQRGYDVTAQLDSQGYNFADLKRWYPGVKFEHTSRYNDNGRGITQQEYVQRTISNLVKQGDGARGNLMLAWNMGGAHSIVYEVKNGQLILKDGQSGKIYSADRMMNKPESLLRTSFANSYARLDNLEPDIERIKKECVR